MVAQPSSSFTLCFIVPTGHVSPFIFLSLSDSLYLFGGEERWRKPSNRGSDWKEKKSPIFKPSKPHCGSHFLWPKTHVSLSLSLFLLKISTVVSSLVQPWVNKMYSRARSVKSHLSLNIISFTYSCLKICSCSPFVLLCFLLCFQTCVLKVNIQCVCEGCGSKVRRILQKIDGTDTSLS